MSLPRAKKTFGQNWLVDQSVVSKIVDAAQIVKGEEILEIGPGTGLLTTALVEAGAQVTAIEADRSLIEPLQEKFDDAITLYEGSALQMDHAIPEGEYKLVANIPYNITSDILHHYLTHKNPPTLMVLMVQKEVADRIVAMPPNMSVLSVVCQLYADCKKVTKVPAGAFRPIPKVDSAVIALKRKDQCEEVIDCEEVIKYAKIGFSSKRKQLQKNLSSLPEVTSDMVKQWLQELGLDPRSRAEVLEVDHWIELTHKIKKNTQVMTGCFCYTVCTPMAIKRLGNRPQRQLSAEQKIAFALLLFLGIGGVYFGFRSFDANLYRPINAQLAELFSGGTYLTADEREDQALEESKTKDTDNDGLVDYDELYVYQTSPYLTDSDSDGYSDKEEVYSGNNPNCPVGRTCGIVVTSDSEEANTAGVSIGEDLGAVGDVDLNSIDPNDPDDIQALFQAMTVEQLRASLIQAGMSEEELSKIDDETLKEFFQESLEQAQADGTLDEGLEEEAE